MNDEIKKELKKLLSTSPVLLNAISALQTNEKIFLDLDPQTLKELKDGSLKFVGGTKATIANSSTGKIIKIPDIAFNGASNVANIANILMAYQQLQMQQQLNEIKDALNSIDVKTDHTIELHHYDNISKIDIAREEYKNYLSTTNNELKIEIATKSYEDYLTAKKYFQNEFIASLKTLSSNIKDGIVKNLTIKDIDSHLSKMKDCLTLIYEAVKSQIELAVEIGEPGYIKVVIDDYKKFNRGGLFKEEMIDMLYQLDSEIVDKNDCYWNKQKHIPYVLSDLMEKKYNFDTISFSINSNGDIKNENMCELQTRTL